MIDWHVPHHYKLGDRVMWDGVDLVCTRDHYAGDAAGHPWDPGAGWKATKAATLWAPNGPDEWENLAAALEPGQLPAPLIKALA